MQGVDCEQKSETYCRDYPHGCQKCNNNKAPSRFRTIRDPPPKAEQIMFQPKDETGVDSSELVYEILMDNVEHYRRPEPIPVKPLMLIMSVRRIPQVQEAFERLDFLDKVYFRNFNATQIADKINNFLQDRDLTGYTHVILTSDDITPSRRNIKQLIEDATQFNLPVVSGFCNLCTFDRHTDHGGACGCCVDEIEHKDTNVTFLPVTLRPLTRSSYSFLTMKWAEEHQQISRVWFQGNACAMIDLSTWRKIRFRSWNQGVGGLMLDLAFAEDCAREKIPQFVDFRVNIRHYGTYHGRLLVGKEPNSIEFKQAEQPLPMSKIYAISEDP